MRWWALWRRLVYGIGFLSFCGVSGLLIYKAYLYVPPTCFDGLENGDERGVDCSGSCVRICSSEIIQPEVQWVRAFRVTEGLYNIVAYVENRNLNIGAPGIPYTVSLYDSKGKIVEKSGEATLPPDSVYPIFEGRIETGDRVPTQAFITLATSTLWLPAVAGREQFSVVDRSLSDADTKPLLTARIRNESLDEATDVDIVATIFDASGNALTASRTKVPLFEGRSTEEITFTWQEPIAKTLRSCEVPTDVILAIDLSGSMNDDGGTPPEPVSSVLTAAVSFVNELTDRDRIGVVTYATDATNTLPLSQNRELVRATIKSLVIDPESERGSTNTGEALLRAQEELLSERHNQNARKVVVLLTDGLATAPKESPEEYAVSRAAGLRQTGAEIFTIGLGASVNGDFLRSIATSDSHYLYAPDTAVLDRIYRDITAAICEDGAAVIEIIPKTSTIFQTPE